jgi:hypothetical protein
MHGSPAVVGADLVVGDNGTFVVRERPNTLTDYVLTVQFRNRPTHHLITRDEHGVVLINKQTWGPPLRSYIAMIERLQKPCEGWPVLLAHPVSWRTGGSLPPSRHPDTGAPFVDAAAEAEEALERQQEEEAARFHSQRLRERQQQEDAMHIQQQQEVLLQKLQKEREAAAAVAAATEEKEKQRRRKVEEEERAVELAARAALASNTQRAPPAATSNSAVPPYVHVGMTRIESDAVLEPCKNESGVWLVRQKGEQTGPIREVNNQIFCCLKVIGFAQSGGVHQYVFVVTYNGKVTYHLVNLSVSGEETTFNGKPCPGCSNIEQVCSNYCFHNVVLCH